jgi:predicted Zn-dependent peptidase
MMIAEVTAEEVFEYMHKMFRDSEKIYSYTIDQKKKDILPSAERMKEILAQAEATSTSPEYPEFAKINLDVTYNNAVTACRNRKDDSCYIEELCAGKRGPQGKRMKVEPVKASNHMVIKAIFDTGFKALPQDNLESARVAAAYITRNFGFRNYTRKDLRDSPVTGNISITMDIERDESAITVLCGKEDVENAVKMLYLTITEPYFDSEKNLEKFKAAQIKALEKGKSDKTAFDDKIRSIRYADNPWRREIKAEHYKALDMTLIRDVFERSFGDAGKLTIYVCDDLSHEESLASDLRNMIASLPVKESKDAVKGRKQKSWPLYKGRHSYMEGRALKTVPKSEVKLSYKYDIKLKNKEFVILDILDYIMDARCMNKIREERGGTYSVTFSTEVFNEGKVAESSIEFQTRPEMTDLLVNDAKTLVKEMAENGPAEAEFENARKYLAKHHSELQARYRQNLSRKLNSYVMKDRYGIDKEKDYLDLLEKTSIRDVRKMAAKIAKGDSMLSVYTEN